MSKSLTTSTLPKHKSAWLIEVEVIEGLEIIAQSEIATQIGGNTILNIKKGAIEFQYRGDLQPLLSLQTVIAVYIIEKYPIPRPRALLGHQHFHRLLKQIEMVRTLWPQDMFSTFYLGAAGSDSSVMNRIKDELARAINLNVASEHGDLLIRIRPTVDKTGWETLVRLSPRPLATRRWRIHNVEGALNASVAHAITIILDPQVDEVFVNLACGSGTILIERAKYLAKQIIGFDNNPAALEIARNHIGVSGTDSKIHLIQSDIRRLPTYGGWADTLCADLPFGQLVGTHQENRELYPLVLNEAARIAKLNARFAIITHEIRLMEQLLNVTKYWHAEAILPITLGGLHPRIYVLKRIIG